MNSWFVERNWIRVDYDLFYGKNWNNIFMQTVKNWHYFRSVVSENYIMMYIFYKNFRQVITICVCKGCYFLIASSLKYHNACCTLMLLQRTKYPLREIYFDTTAMICSHTLMNWRRTWLRTLHIFHDNLHT